MKEQQLQLVTFEQAKKLKKVGFDFPTEFFYNSDKQLRYIREEEPECWDENWNIIEDCCSAPTVALALKWFRDAKKVMYKIGFCKIFGFEVVFLLNDANITEEIEDIDGSILYFDTYEQAESALLDELLKLIENENITK